MIIKVLSLKKPHYEKLFNYMMNDKERVFDHEQKSFVLRHNLKGESIEGWAEQFKENEEYRKHNRANSVLLTHEILSWHKDDVKNITIDKMEEMARKYIQLRNPEGMYIAVPHTDKEHFHIHIAASGVEYHTGKSLRMSKKDFTELKRNIQSYQKERFPELINSIVEHGKTKKKA